MRSSTAVVLTFLLCRVSCSQVCAEVAQPAGPPAARVEAAGKFLLDTGHGGAHGLSGLAWAGALGESTNIHTYYAVSDARPEVFRLHVRLDERTGAVKEARVVERIPLDRGADCEDLAWDSRDGTLWVADEEGPSVRQFTLSGSSAGRRGSMARELEIPGIFRTRRANLGFEAVALDGERGLLWTANEEALPADGEPSGVEAGSTVRLLQFGPELRPAAQYACVTEPVGRRPPHGHSRERSGLVALSVLPDGSLLALERALDVQRVLIADVPVFTSRIFLLDTTDATDVSAMQEGLRDAKFHPVRKTLLWEKSFGLDGPNNFEGMALGPRLSDGSWSLLLISDDEKGMLEQSLFALRVYLQQDAAGKEPQ